MLSNVMPTAGLKDSSHSGVQDDPQNGTLHDFCGVVHATTKVILSYSGVKDGPCIRKYEHITWQRWIISLKYIIHFLTRSGTVCDFSGVLYPTPKVGSDLATDSTTDVKQIMCCSVALFKIEFHHLRRVKTFRHMFVMHAPRIMLLGNKSAVGRVSSSTTAAANT